MAQTYTVRVLSDKQFEANIKKDGRYRNGVDSWGFADPVKRVAFVRDTKIDELNRHLVNHEFEHLVEEHASDEDEYGIRHKKGFIRNAAAILAAPFTGGTSLLASSPGQHPVVGSENTFLNQAANAIYKYTPAVVGSVLAGPPGAALGQAVSGYAQGQKTGQIAKNSAIAGATSYGMQALGSGLQNFSPTGNAAATTTRGVAGSAAPKASGLSMAPSGASGGSIGSKYSLLAPQNGAALAQSFKSSPQIASSLQPVSQAAFAPSYTAPQLSFNQPSQPTNQPNLSLGGNGGGGGGSPPPSGGLSQLQSSNNQALGSLNTGNLTIQPAQQATQQTAQQTQVSKLLGSLGIDKARLGQLALGAGTSYLADRMGPQYPTVPDLSSLPSVQRLEQGAGKPMSALGELGQKQLSSRLSQTFSGLPENVGRGIRDSYAQERERLISQFKTLRPNADLTTDSAFRQAMFDLDRREANDVATAEQSAYNTFNQTRTDDIAAALGIDKQTLETFTNLAQLDIQEIQAQLELDEAAARDFKNTWGSIGAQIASGGYGSVLGNQQQQVGATP